MLSRAKIACGLFLALALLAVGASPASAHLLLAKDGKIHACYKAKGKGKGTLHVVRNGKVRCPRKWRKVSWYAVAPATPGASGPQGVPGLQGAPGPIDTAAVEALENRVTELLNRVKSLETVVGSLCAQTEALNEQTTALGSTLNSLGTVLEVALVAFEAPTVPTALPSYNCPTF